MIHENAEVQLLGFYFMLKLSTVRMLDFHSTQVGSIQAFAETPWGHIESFLWSGWCVCHSSEWQRASAIEQDFWSLERSMWWLVASGERLWTSKTVLIWIHSSIYSPLHLHKNCLSSASYEFRRLCWLFSLWSLPLLIQSSGKDRQETKNYTEKWIPLKLISHNDNEFSEEDFLGVLIVRRAQPRERTIKQGDDMSYEEGGPEGYGRGRDALFPQELQGEPREKTSWRLRVGGLSLFTIRI